MTMHVPAEVILPGEFIKDEMDARGWTHDDLAEVMGISRRQVINLLSGKTAISANTAHLLADAFGQEAQAWMNIQIAYELAMAAKEDRDVARRSAIYGKVPVREMIRRGWIADSRDVDVLESEVKRFLDITNIDDTPTIAAAARKGTEYSTDSPAHLAWYFAVRHLADRAPAAAKYADSNLESCIDDLKQLAAYPEDVRRVPKVLADAGIRLVFVQHLKGTRIDGVAMWKNDRPIIGLSLRYDRIDNFWFTLLHELIHIKHRDKERVDVDIEAQKEDEIEQRANREAAAYLIEPEKMESFILRNKRVFYQKKVVKFAQARGVHPAIVVGQLKHRGELPPSHLNGLQAKVREELIGHAVTDGWGHTPLQPIGER